MALRRPGMPQRYSPPGEYDYGSNEVMPSLRRPLGESTGNVQAPHLSTLALCHQLSPPIHSIPTPPFVPSQVVSSTYGTSFRSQRSIHRDVSLREPPMGSARGGRNPIYAWKHFADYRSKVTQKESENEEPPWPLYLEDAFLDALLLIPLMGRKKFSSKGVLYGRNMLITEYLWICHWLLFPPQPGEVVPVGKSRDSHKAYRGRKQVSSHIQVLKGFFVSHPLFHFFFPRRNDDDKDEDRKGSKDEDCATESFKNNRVLIALAEGRLPDERPNYEYFARLLAGDSETFVRPKTCWIYVSSSDVKLNDDCKKAHALDGTYMDSDAYASDGTRLDGKGDYPHLVLNSNKDYKRDLNRDKESAPNYLLHEYTRTITQKESSSVKDIASRWDHRFPELKEKLEVALDDTHPSHERTSRCVVGPCDTFHFEVVLDLHATSQFPSGTHINGVVQLSICRPDLAGHNWRSVTSVAKPAHLENEREQRYWDSDDQCDLTGRGNSRDTIEVPFPASSWANTFIKLAPYVRAERERKERERMNASRSKVKRDDGDAKSSGKTPTPKDLLAQVAMYQEIWSAPNDGSEEPRWTRRAVILWTFSNSSSKVDAKGKVSTVPAGTSWRFLTKLDPTSSYHQQRAYVSGAPTLSRDSVMSPNPPYAHHLHAAMHENFNQTYDAPAMTLPGQQHSQLAGLNLQIDAFPHGLATPPPTASLPSTFPHGFDSRTSSFDSTMTSTDSFQPALNFLPNSTADSQPALVSSNQPNDFSLSGLGVPVSTYEEPDSWSGPQDGLQSLDNAGQWATTTYADSQQSLAWAPAPSNYTDPSNWSAATNAATTNPYTTAVTQQPWLPSTDGSGRPRPQPLQRCASSYSDADCGSYMSSSTSSVGGDMKGRKRMRSEDLHEDEGIPSHTMRKLSHVEERAQSFRM